MCYKSERCEGCGEIVYRAEDYAGDIPALCGYWKCNKNPEVHVFWDLEKKGNTLFEKDLKIMDVDEIDEALPLPDEASLFECYEEYLYLEKVGKTEAEIMDNLGFNPTDFLTLKKINRLSNDLMLLLEFDKIRLSQVNVLVNLDISDQEKVFELYKRSCEEKFFTAKDLKSIAKDLTQQSQNFLFDSHQNNFRIEKKFITAKGEKVVVYEDENSSVVVIVEGIEVFRSEENSIKNLTKLV